MTKQLTRERLIQAALTLFKEKGYTAASTRDIAEKAGVNHLTLFRHFGSKRNLFRESVIQHVTSGDFLAVLPESSPAV
ncbi:helix-turn-helix domain-containing protein [Bacillus sonorensis]|nr:helix-turn-helix domain-containing protein [Bacillus sonorensis]